MKKYIAALFVLAFVLINFNFAHADCNPGDLFSFTTGKACTGSVEGSTGQSVSSGTSSSSSISSITPSSTLDFKIGAKGVSVKNLQQLLKDAGFLNGKVDGFYGPITKKAWLAYRKNQNNCIPQPACVLANPRCLIAEPVGGWCVNNTSYVNIKNNGSYNFTQNTLSSTSFTASLASTETNSLFTMTGGGNVPPGMTFSTLPCNNPAGSMAPCPMMAPLNTLFLKGTPTTAGNYVVTVTATAQNSYSVTNSFLITIKSPDTFVCPANADCSKLVN